jgi:hypothetical protein
LGRSRCGSASPPSTGKHSKTSCPLYRSCWSLMVRPSLTEQRSSAQHQLPSPRLALQPAPPLPAWASDRDRAAARPQNLLTCAAAGKGTPQTSVRGRSVYPPASVSRSSCIGHGAARSVTKSERKPGTGQTRRLGSACPMINVSNRGHVLQSLLVLLDRLYSLPLVPLTR